jgi:hypothetical protein
VLDGNNMFWDRFCGIKPAQKERTNDARNMLKLW